MKKAFIFPIVFAVIFGCTASKNTDSTAQTKDFKKVMETKAFSFTADWANPMATQSLNSIANAGLLPPGSNAGSIQLNGTSNFLKVEGDTVSANLPYFGERRFGGGYGSNTGIEFKGVPTSYDQAYNTDKNRFDITFLISEDMEAYNVTLTVFANKTANVIVNSNQRNPIRYAGHVGAREN